MKKDGRGGARVGAGRPRGITKYKGQKRDKQLTIRLTQGELEILNKLSEELKLSRADVIVKSIEKFIDEK